MNVEAPTIAEDSEVESRPTPISGLRPLPNGATPTDRLLGIANRAAAMADSVRVTRQKYELAVRQLTSRQEALVMAEKSFKALSDEFRVELERMIGGLK